MNQMSFERALSILELDRDYDEEKLKKSYRKLAHLWHPDKGNDPSGEKFKELHEAYEFLGKFKNDINSRPHVNLSAYLKMCIQQAINLVSSYVENTILFINHEFEDDIMICHSRIKRLINLYINKIKNVSSESRLEAIINELDVEYEKILLSLFNVFERKYPYVKSMNFKVNYDLKLSGFVAQMDSFEKQIKDKVDKKVRIDTIHRFNGYVGYDILEKDILKMIDAAVNNVITSDSSKEQTIIDDMNERVEILFESVFDLQMRINRLDSMYEEAEGIESFILRMKLDELKANIKNDDFYDQADFISKHISIINNNEYIRDIYKHLVSQYNNCLKYIDPLEDTEVAQKAMKIFDKAMKLLFSYKDGIVNYDILSYLFGIKFENLEQDEKILSFAYNKSDVFNPGYVYVSKNVVSPFACIYNLDGDYQFRYKNVNGTRSMIIYSGAEICGDYISLSLALANAEYVGKEGYTIAGNGVAVLYRYMNMYFVLTSNGVITVMDVNKVKLYNEEVSYLEEYKDKQLVLNKISNRVKSEFPLKK